MKANELRNIYIEFFKSKDHKLIQSASLLPENDPTVLFTTAGMHPLVPFLLGQTHVQGKRLVSTQKCIRTIDIDEVGDRVHHTFFEMLGNWSLGDYFKKEAIEYSFEFLTKFLNIPAEKLAVSCFKGDEHAPKDIESADKWESLGIPKHKIIFLPKQNNWWRPAGETGPCGPDTEMFYYIGERNPSEASNPETDEDNWVEIWNDVFMQYNKTKEGKYEPLKQKNVDTGMGLERTLAVLNGYDDNYKTDLWWPIIKEIQALSGMDYDGYSKEMRIIADHIKAATFILGDNKGIVPSNLGQGYIVRRLIRRAIRYAWKLNMKETFCHVLADQVIAMYREQYPELEKNKHFIITELRKEEERFSEVIEKGMKQFDKVIKDKKISGEDAFLLFQSYGFPIELTQELALEKEVVVDVKGYEEEFKKHQELSRTATEGMFKSGLADHSEQTTKLHTAAHLLLSALNRVLLRDITQKGSNINPERLRLDFNLDRKLTDEEKKKVEDQVNTWIKQALPVTKEEMTVEKAKAQGAQGAFEHKYGEKVYVYTIGESSKEICSGPHVQNTRELGHFKIKKEESVAAGVRRIKAILD